MTIALDNRASTAVVFMLVAFNGIFLSANGLFMLVAPLSWYELVPGVTDTGFFNQHFIRDIGIIQLFIGIAFGWGLIRPEYRIGLWAAATLWLGRARRVPLVGSCRRHLLSLGHSPRFSRGEPAGDHWGSGHSLGHQSRPHRTTRIRLRHSAPQPLDALKFQMLFHSTTSRPSATRGARCAA